MHTKKRNICAFDIETSGLSFLDSRITCIGIKTEDFERTFSNPDERQLLIEFKHEIDELLYNNFVFYGYNSWKFDVPFIRARFMFHRLKMPQAFLAFNESLFYDIYHIFRMQKGKLVEWSSFTGYKYESPEIMGADMPLLLEKGCFSEISDHCLDDIRQTYKIAVLMDEVGIWR